MIVIKKKNAPKPKLCKRKSAIKPPYTPNRLLIATLCDPRIKVGSLGEYVKKEIASNIELKIKNKPINSIDRFFKKTAILL
jgi:hypothetical protein|tara:strand:- start:42 stop:284 length:243 start_codon:yes stop_codon:yes gene_type:complete